MCAWVCKGGMCLCVCDQALGVCLLCLLFTAGLFVLQLILDSSWIEGARGPPPPPRTVNPAGQSEGVEPWTAWSHTYEWPRHWPVNLWSGLFDMLHAYWGLMVSSPSHIIALVHYGKQSWPATGWMKLTEAEVLTTGSPIDHDDKRNRNLGC